MDTGVCCWVVSPWPKRYLSAAPHDQCEWGSHRSYVRMWMPCYTGKLPSHITCYGKCWQGRLFYNTGRGRWRIAHHNYQSCGGGLGDLLCSRGIVHKSTSEMPVPYHWMWTVGRRYRHWFSPSSISWERRVLGVLLSHLIMTAGQWNYPGARYPPYLN